MRVTSTALLALSLCTAAVPALADWRPTPAAGVTTSNDQQRNGCSRAPEFRPIWCYPHHPHGFAWGWSNKSGAYRASERQQQRQAFLERRDRDYHR